MTEQHHRIRVDPNLCEGHALCVDLAPDVFELSDDEVATCPEQPAKEALERIRAAIDACPRQAISFIQTTERTARR